MQMQCHTTGDGLRREWARDHALDIVLRLDDAGFVVDASPNSKQLGIDLSALLVMPHICDFADADHADTIATLFDGARAGNHPGRWCDFLLANPGIEPAELHAKASGKRWFALWLEPCHDRSETQQSCIAILRSAEARYAMADQIEALSAIDPLTGLANRPAFCGSLARMLAHQDTGDGAAMAIFAIDRMRALFMQYGQQTADEIRWGFARFLETMTHADHALALLDEERFAVLLPGLSMRDARRWASDALQTFAGLTAGVSGRTQELTASAGLARVEHSVDWTLRQAEMGLVMARAGGGMRVGTCKPASRIGDGAAMEQAIQAAIERAQRRAQ